MTRFSCQKSFVSNFHTILLFLVIFGPFWSIFLRFSFYSRFGSSRCFVMAYGSRKYRGKTALRWYKKGSLSTVKPSKVSRVKMQKPTARNQQKQIIKNSKAISNMLKTYNRNIVYTDYQLASSDALNRNAWVNVPLTNVEFWQPVMRRSIAIQNTKMTTCVKMQLNIRYDMGQFIKASVYWNVFLVRPRQQGAGQITTPLILNLDYTEQC